MAGGGASRKGLSIQSPRLSPRPGGLLTAVDTTAPTSP